GHRAGTVQQASDGVLQVSAAFQYTGLQEVWIGGATQQTGLGVRYRVGTQQAQQVVVAQGNVFKRFILTSQNINRIAQIGVDQSTRTNRSGEMVVAIDQRQQLRFFFRSRLVGIVGVIRVVGIIRIIGIVRVIRVIRIVRVIGV